MHESLFRLDTAFAAEGRRAINSSFDEFQAGYYGITTLMTVNRITTGGRIVVFMSRTIC